MPKVISKDGTPIAYDRTGSGPVVVLIGGALQHRCDHLFSRLAPALAKQLSVIDFDRRGRGESGDTPPYAPAREVEDLEALLGAVGAPVSLFGMSSGGALALEAACTLRGIEKVAVYEPPFVAGDPGYASELHELIAAGHHDDALRLFMKRVGMPRALVALLRWTPMWKRLRKLAPTLEHDAALMGDGTVPGRYASITTPTLVLTGSSDTMRAAAGRLVEVLPRARRETLEGQTHDVSPAVLAPALTRFLLPESAPQGPSANARASSA